MRKHESPGKSKTMRVVFTLEHHFSRTPDGGVWTQTAYAYPFWSRYLQVFDRVHILARVGDSEEVASNWMRADGGGVSFARLPNYVGPLHYLLNLPAIARAMRAGFQFGDAVVLRVPSALASNLAPRLGRMHYPYAVKVVGDPYDAFAARAVRHPLRAVWRWWFTTELRRLCAGAMAATYVTQAALQRRYPCPGYVVGSSDVQLDAGAFVSESRHWATARIPFRLIFVGSLAQLYKAPDVLIKAVAKCKSEGLAAELEIVGEGKHRGELEQLVRALGISDRVKFLGQLPAGDAVRARFDRADLFVLPSRSEGLPRAMIEAMARALPCLGSAIGGIPELLPPEDLVPPGDVDALAHKICAVAADPPRLTRMSRRNWNEALNFKYDTLLEREMAFCRHVREGTAAWLKNEGYGGLTASARAALK